MLRLFVSIPVPEPVGDALVPLQRAVPGARWSPRENFHLTLRFIGEVDEALAGDLDERLAAIAVAPFELSASRGGFFGGANPHALFVHVDGGEPLATLRRRCERACREVGLEADTRAYTPHVTLAYLGAGVEPALVHQFERVTALFRAGPWMADRFQLVSSHRGRGANLYRVEAEYPLGV
jgi:RNA 2',3'-cyclic 3'-phosphodiesterase